MTIEEALQKATMTIPEAGATFFGLGRSGAYEAAKRGDLPTIKVGRRLIVPVAPLAEKIGLRSLIGAIRS